MTLSDNSKKRVAQGTAAIGVASGVVGISMTTLSLFLAQACFLPFNAGHELEKLKEIWTPGNTLGDFNISAVSLLVGGWLVYALAMHYLDSNKKDTAATNPREIPMQNFPISTK